MYHTRWQDRALYNNTNHTHARTHARTHTHTHSESDEGMGRAVKNSLEIIIKQVRLQGGFERGGRIRVAECLRQIVPDRWASIRKRSFTKCIDRRSRMSPVSLSIPLIRSTASRAATWNRLKGRSNRGNLPGVSWAVYGLSRPPVGTVSSGNKPTMTPV